MELNFCRRCGTEITPHGEGFRCVNGHMLYASAAAAAGIFFVTEDNQLVLSVRGIEPYKGQLDAFGGFVELNESVEEALEREIKEEVCLDPSQYETPQFLCTATAPYPFDGEVRTILAIMFWARLKPGAQPVAADDVADIKYVPLADVPYDQLGNSDVPIGVKKLQEILL